MIALAKWLLPCLAALILSSCGKDVMQILKERNQPVGVLILKPTPPDASTGRLVFIDSVATVQPEGDQKAASVIGVYDNNAKTFRTYGQTFVARLKSHGIDARLLDSYPLGDSLRKKGMPYRSLASYPAEIKKYPLCLVLNESVILGVRNDSRYSPIINTNAWLIDSNSHEILSEGFGGKVHFLLPLRTRADVHSVLDESTRSSRQDLMDDIFYQYKE